MTEPSAGDVTRLLRKWRSGDPEAEGRLFELVTPDLRRLAGYFMGRERPDHTVTPTALLSEIYFRLAKARETDWQDRQHFFALAAKAMRHFLVDYARARPKGERVAMDSQLPDSDRHLDTVVAVDAVLATLAKEHPELAAIVDFKFFLGMTDQEAADALGWPLRTAQRRWHDARAWLFERLGDAL